MSYVTISGVTFVDTLPSGKAFKVKYEGREIVVPNFAVHDDSEVWSGCDPDETGDLILRTDIAAEKGLTDPGSGSLGGGIPLKRNRLPDPPELVSDKVLKGIRERVMASSAFGPESSGWDTAGEVVRLKHTDDDVAIFDGERRFHDAQLCAYAPDDLWLLLRENERLREWVELATKRFNARRKRR